LEAAGVESQQKTVLLIDDDPSHLKLYSWVLNRGGFRALTVLVRGDRLDLPKDEHVDLAVLDYRIGPRLTAVQVAQMLNHTFPAKPIVVLSDMAWLPQDIAPFATGFVRKGEPEQMLEIVGKLIVAS
jgi:DNA-binding response OmpR family regulator